MCSSCVVNVTVAAIAVPLMIRGERRGVVFRECKKSLVLQRTRTTIERDMAVLNQMNLLQRRLTQRRKWHQKERSRRREHQEWCLKYAALAWYIATTILRLLALAARCRLFLYYKY